MEGQPGSIDFSHGEHENLYVNARLLESFAKFVSTDYFKPHVVVVDSAHPPIFIEAIPDKIDLRDQFMVQLQFNKIYDDTIKVGIVNAKDGAKMNNGFFLDNKYLSAFKSKKSTGFQTRSIGNSPTANT